jgi:hypothetical protein
VPKPKPTTGYTVEQMQQLLIAGGKHNGRHTVQAAIHLLTYTELPQHRGFGELVKVQEIRDHEGQPVTAAFVRDWKALPNAPTAHYLGGGDHRLLALAISMATGEPVDLYQNLSGFGHAHMRRVIEAVAIATGGAEFYTVASTAALNEVLARRDALFS